MKNKKIITGDITQYGEICQNITKANGAIFKVEGASPAKKLFDLIQKYPEIQKTTSIFTEL